MHMGINLAVQRVKISQNGETKIKLKFLFAQYFRKRIYLKFSEAEIRCPALQQTATISRCKGFRGILYLCFSGI